MPINGKLGSTANHVIEDCDGIIIFYNTYVHRAKKKAYILYVNFFPLGSKIHNLIFFL